MNNNTNSMHLGNKYLSIEKTLCNKEGKINFPLFNADMVIRDSKIFIYECNLENCIVLVKHIDLKLLNQIVIPEDYISVLTFSVVTDAKTNIKELYVFFDCDLDRYDDMIAYLKEYDFVFL